METEKEILVSMRVPADLKRAFEETCKAADQTVSQVLRAAMRAYVRENAQGELLTPKKVKK